MSRKQEIEIKNKIIKVKEGNETNEYEIQTKGGKQTIEWEKGEKDELSKNELKLEFKKKGTDKWSTTEFNSKVKWTGGYFVNSMELEKKDLESGKTAEGTISLPTGFFGTLTIISWIGLVVIVIAIIGLIWWWIASSKSEDKEEESL